MCFCKSLEALLLGESFGPGNTGKAGFVRLVEVDHIHFSFCDRLYILYMSIYYVLNKVFYIKMLGHPKA